MNTEIFYVLSCAVLGVFLGAQLTEAILIVPYWKQMQPNEFFNLHKTYGIKIYKFFAPLTIAATIIPLITVFIASITNSSNHVALYVMGMSTLLFFSSYFLYFKKANHRFKTRDIQDHNLTSELNTWEKWHWGRILFETIAFVSALLLLII